MIVITIAGILAAVAIPSYQTMVKNNCMTTEANTLVASLQLARSEAVRRRQPVRITAATPGVTTNEWGTGWTVWVDTNADGAMQSGEVLRQVDLTCGTTTVDEPSNITTFTYRPTGFLDTTTAGGSFQVCDDRTAETGRQITIAPTGRPSINSSFTCS